MVTMELNFLCIWLQLSNAAGIIYQGIRIWEGETKSLRTLAANFKICEEGHFRSGQSEENEEIVGGGLTRTSSAGTWKGRWSSSEYSRDVYTHTYSRLLQKSIQPVLLQVWSRQTLIHHIGRSTTSSFKCNTVLSGIHDRTYLTM